MANFRLCVILSLDSNILLNDANVRRLLENAFIGYNPLKRRLPLLAQHRNS
jgi:hypothetical protein